LNASLEHAVNDHEDGTISAMLVDADIAIQINDMLTPEAFWQTANRGIFKAISELIHKNESTETMQVIEELRRTGKLEAIGGEYIVHALALDAGTPKHALANYAPKVLEYHRRRITKRNADVMSSMAYSATYEDLVEQAVLTATDIESVSRRIESTATMTDPMLAELKTRTPQTSVGISTGLTDLDDKILGLLPGNLIVTPAETGMGKTTFGLHLARAANVPVLYLSTEMSANELFVKMVASEAGVDSNVIRRGATMGSQKDRLDVAGEILKKKQIYIDDRSIPIAEACASIRAHVRKGVKLVIADYLQKFDPPSGKGNRELEVGSIASALKRVAHEQQIPIVAPAQISRDTKGRADKHPQLSDIRESGRIEQDADIVMGLFWPSRYDDGIDEKEYHLCILKHRNGSLGRVKVWFQPETGRFSDWR
jgi:replicative DNA helicase